jgi:hypothetical protein
MQVNEVQEETDAGELNALLLQDASAAVMAGLQ